MSLDTSRTYRTRDGRATGLRVKRWERKTQFVDRRYDGYEFEVVGDATIHPGFTWVVAADGRYTKGLLAEHPWDLVVEGRAPIDLTKTFRTVNGKTTGIRLKNCGERGHEYPLKVVAASSDSDGLDAVDCDDWYTLAGCYLGDGEHDSHSLDLIEEPSASDGSVSTPFLLEEGKLYSTRDGQYHDIAVVKVTGDSYPFRCREGYFKNCGFLEGGFFSLDKREDDWDLVAETAPVAEPINCSTTINNSLKASGAGKPAKLTSEIAYRTRDGRFGGVFVEKSGNERYPWRVVAAQDEFMLGRTHTKRGYFVGKNSEGALDLVPDDGYRAPKPVEVVAPEPAPAVKPAAIRVRAVGAQSDWIGVLRHMAKTGESFDFEHDGILYKDCRVTSIDGEAIKLSGTDIAFTKSPADMADASKEEVESMMRGVERVMMAATRQLFEAGMFVKLCDHLGTEGKLLAIDTDTGRGFVRHSGDTHSIKLDRLETAPWRPRVGEMATCGGGAMAWPVAAIHGGRADIGPFSGREAISLSSLRAPDKGSQLQAA